MGWITAIVGFKCNQLIPNVCVNSTNFRHCSHEFSTLSTCCSFCSMFVWVALNWNSLCTIYAELGTFFARMSERSSVRQHGKPSVFGWKLPVCARVRSRRPYAPHIYTGPNDGIRILSVGSLTLYLQYGSFDLTQIQLREKSILVFMWWKKWRFFPYFYLRSFCTLWKWAFWLTMPQMNWYHFHVYA